MYYNRYLKKWLLETGKGKARLILGARQTGKSTLFSMLRSPDDLVIDLQDRSERMRFARDPRLILRKLDTRKKHTSVFIDEIQRVPALLDEIQLLLDRYPRKYTFTLTGSSARKLHRKSTNLLPGRLHLHYLQPVTLWEEKGRELFRVLPPGYSVPEKRFSQMGLSARLITGSLPGAYVDDEYVRTLESYAEIYVDEEILREAVARNIGDYGRFLEMAALESGKPINLTKISQETGLALSTLRGFYRILEDTLLGFSIQPFSRSNRARIIRTPRFYFFDTGVRNAVARLPLTGDLLKTEAGQLFEHWVACELYSRVQYCGRSHRLSYWRTVDGAEVDFILETSKGVFPIEVKYTDNPRPADARGVEHFISRYPGLVKCGFVVCRCSHPEQLTPNTTAIPWHEL